LNLKSFYCSLIQKNIECRENEKMDRHTTFKIGGNADIFVCPKTKKELSFALKCAKDNDVSVFILGKGSNLLVSDSGIEGAVICLSNLDGVSVLDNTITCGAGANLSLICTTALKHELSGMEFAYGIPGSVGGAVYMNAGAYGGEMSQIVKGAYCLDFSGNEVYIDNEKMNFGYRNSAFKQNGLIVTEVIIELNKGDKNEIADKMQDLLSRRKDKQPLEYPSAGSTFKRPLNNFAGTLIEKNGLKGKTVGGAMVSEKHAGFVINFDNATALDVKNLIKQVQDAVYKNDGIMLETEVIFVGK